MRPDKLLKKYRGGDRLNKQNLFYRLILATIVVGPFLLTQGYAPLFSSVTWENLSESFYPSLSFSKSFPKKDSDVVMVEIDHESEKRYGWPMDRSLYVKFLDQLKASGRPHVLSLLKFQKVGETEEELQKNERLSQAIADYGRYIGSGLYPKREDQEGMTYEEEEALLPKALATPPRTDFSDLPDLELALDEDPMFIASEKRFGTFVPFGTQPVIHCVRTYQPWLKGVKLAIPTNLLWATALQLKRDFVTSEGIRSHLEGANGLIKVGWKSCLSHPEVDTAMFFKKRNIPIKAFHEVIEGKFKANEWQGKIVLLSGTRLRKFQGPGGNPRVPDSGIIPEHHLLARFLDNIISDQIIHRSPIFDSEKIRLLSLAFFASLFVMSLYSAPPMLAGFAFFFFFLSLAWSVVSINHQQHYLIPVPLFLQNLLMGILFSMLWAYQTYQGMRRIVFFRQLLRNNLVGLQDFDSFDQKVKELIAKEFPKSTATLSPVYQELYESAKTPESVAEYLTKKTKKRDLEPAPEPERPLSMTMRGLIQPEIQAMGAFHIKPRGELLGTIELYLTFQSWEKGIVGQIFSNALEELAEQWARIHAVTLKKIDDYEALVVNARSEILEKFLSQSIIDKFQDGRTMEECLNEILNPRHAKAAILQADIRGYSNMFENKDPFEIVTKLRSYYQNTVDAAQLVAQVKLIGDCIFLFIEETDHSSYSAADYAVILSGILIHETAKENSRQVKQGEKPVVFGIAIHYGDVILGNLSSANCIDYTVVGPNVNRTARMEELTKKEEVRELVGANGVLISKEAEGALRVVHKKVKVQHMDLLALNLSIRSFPNIKELSYIRPEEAVLLADDDIYARKTG